MTIENDILQRHGGIYKNNHSPANMLSAYLAFKTGLPVVAKLISGRQNGTEYTGTDIADYEIGLEPPTGFATKMGFHKFQPFITVHTESPYVEGDPDSHIDVRLYADSVTEEKNLRFYRSDDRGWEHNNPAEILEAWVDQNGLARTISDNAKYRPSHTQQCVNAHKAASKEPFRA